MTESFNWETNPVDHVEKFLGELHDNGIIEPSGVGEDGNLVYSINDMDALALHSPEVYEVYRAMYIHGTYKLFIEGDLVWEVEDYSNRLGKFVLTEGGKKKFNSVEHALTLAAQFIAGVGEDTWQPETENTEEF